ncbi:MAG: hypothetical protein ACLFO5_06250, partial [Opitutales bacterium]
LVFANLNKARGIRHAVIGLRERATRFTGELTRNDSGVGSTMPTPGKPVPTEFIQACPYEVRPDPFLLPRVWTYAGLSPLVFANLNKARGIRHAVIGLRERATRFTGELTRNDSGVGSTMPTPGKPVPTEFIQACPYEVRPDQFSLPLVRSYVGLSLLEFANLNKARGIRHALIGLREGATIFRGGAHIKSNLGPLSSSAIPAMSESLRVIDLNSCKGIRF